METYTTDDALTAMGFGKLQGLVLVYAGMGWVAEAMEVMLLSFVGPLIREEWKISAQDESLLSSVVFLGMLIGACGWGYVSDKYGRRTGLLLSTLFTTGMGFLSALSPNYLCLMALRFLVGVGLGGSHVYSSWFLEFVPAQNRGFWMIIFSFFWTIGTVLEASLAWIVVSTLTWRWLLALTAIPCFLLLPFFGITPESPRYLCAQNRISDATLVLERIAETNQATLPPGVLVYPRDGEVDHSTLTSEADHLLPLREKECTDDDVTSPKSGSAAALRSLLSRKLRRSTLLLWFVFYANSFAYYGLVLLTAQLSNANKSCASGLKYVKSETDASLYKDTFVTSLAATMWCLLFTCCGFLGPLVFYQSELWTTGLLFGARACAMGSYTVVCLYAPEVRIFFSWHAVNVFLGDLTITV
ncbi:hypothetical protein CFC21_073423 [Triticum aestivum]|uniref:Major facilitator superfamily (MFS) profile domain-containing protein n=3 Tax=Triticum TaxID=4564 RepID=A0A9R0XGV1_TRITD|nr:hypothetical protein CFC21_073423 [Triticum aestivum]VAI36367.1 unnamed protein product [Triticum turgidum subsp. durum]